jgi:ketosteroid isomerase-like protein
MSEENVERVRRGLEAFNAGDDEAALAMYDPQVEIQTLLGARYHGHDGFRAAAVEVRDTLEGLTLETREVFAVGDHVIAMMRLGGRGRSSGVPHPGGEFFAMAYTLRDGLVIRQRSFRSRDEALEAVGERG